MAKKSARKEITKINLKQAALEGLSYERACETAKRAGKPSYRFTVGDKVQVGHLLNCVVDEALEGGYMYLIRSGANSDNYSCWAWTNVRPLDDDKDTHFAKRNSALSRLHYSNRSMYSLLSFQYLFGVDFNPDYQRGSVWDDEDREKLLDSIFMGREIGRFVFKQLPFTRTSNDGNYYEIVVTKINLKQAALEGLSYERACETAKRAGKPSYRFTVGDKVQVGHLLNCVVDEALEGGYMYLIRSGANSDNYSCWAWTNVRPLDDDKDTHFAKRNSALSRLHYSNRSMYSLLSFQYLFGVDFNPDYQRGSVWDDEDREKLLDSIFMGREIGRFVFKQLPFTRTSNDGNYYEIVDGKQRMLTLLAFYENRFPYKGVFYNDLSAQDKNWFMDASIGVAEIDQSVTRAEVLEIFLAMNEGGKPVTKEVLDHARELLNEEKGEGL